MISVVAVDYRLLASLVGEYSDDITLGGFFGFLYPNNIES